MREYYQIEKCETIRELLHKRAGQYAEKPVFGYWNEDRSSQIVVSPKDFEKQVAHLGEWFLNQGFHKKMIALYGENSYEWILTFFAVVCSGNTAVLLDYHSSKEELEELISFNDCEAVCFSPTYKEIAAELKSGTALPFYEMTELYRIASKNVTDRSCEIFAQEPVSADDLAVIAFTSGTTGKKKGVMLTHRNLLEDWWGTARQLNVSGTILKVLPLYHLFGLSVMMILFIWGGMSFICDSMRYIVQDISAVRPENIEAVPAMLPIIFQAFSVIDCPYGVRLICGGAPADLAWKERFKSIHAELYFGYGMTECGPIIATNSELFDHSDGSVKVIGTNKVFIDYPDENGIGEVLVKGANVMQGYYKMPEETAEAIKDGWLHTGDLGRLDKDGFLMLTGRKKNLLILPNGENIAPEALERKVMAVTGVTECMACLRESVLTVEIYAPDMDKKTVTDAVYNMNETLSASHRIMKIVFRDKPFEKNTAGKKIREK